jgi:hypothetical protein
MHMHAHRIDARAVSQKIEPALPRLGGSNPGGDTIAFTTASMTWNDAPWLGVSGEIHYARLPRRAWREALQKMKGCGVDIASTYVFWIHHEEIEGTFDWSGDRDLRAFVETCARERLPVIVRIGPFCHGEVRNGGLPDWLYGRPFPVRSTDGRYLAHVKRLYDEIGRQLEGLYFKDGGPIIGIQLENELLHAGAPWETVPRQGAEWVPAGTDGVEQMRALKKLAQEAGMQVPVYTSTGWGGAAVLRDEVLPLYGGYAFCPWNVTPSSPVHAPTKEYIFRDFHRSGVRYDVFDPPYDPAAYPFAGCEIGGGMQAWYLYRSVVPAQAAEAVAVVKLAGGCSLLGYYMFHGGSNPVGAAGGFLNEHVVPRISYDFQAPLGEFGQVRESYRRLRRLHLFCHDFAAELVRAGTALPDGAASIDPADVDTLRFAARASGDTGFLFFNNYRDHAETRNHEEVAVELSLPGGPLRIPRKGGFTVKSGHCAVLPFNLDLGGIRLRSATAQPIATLRAGDTLHCFFFAHDGITAEYCLGNDGIAAVETGDCSRTEEDDLLLMRPRPGTAGWFSLQNAGGVRVVVHTLTEEQSLGFARLDVWGGQRIVLTDADVFESDGTLVVRPREQSAEQVDIRILPPPEAPLFSDGVRLESSQDGMFSLYRVGVPVRHIELALRRESPSIVEIRLPPGAFDGLRDVILSIEYDGDVGSAFIEGRLIADNFANGMPWEIGLERLRPDVEEKPICLRISPRREGTLVMRESGMALQQTLQGREIAEARSVTANGVREARVSARG